MTHTEPANPEGRSEEAILALCDAATPGPWYRDYDRIITRDYDPEVDPDDFPAMQRRCTVAETNPFKRTISRDARHIADAAFIAAARTDVPTLLAALAAARSDADQLRTENERLSALVDRQLGYCIGCRHDEGPDEVCPHHGRTYSEWVQIASDVIGRSNDLRAERDAARVEVDRLRDEFDRYRAEAMDFVRRADQNEGQRQRADRLAVEVDTLRAKIGEIHKPKTFEARTDWHHSEAVAATGDIAPRRHDCDARCFEWVTICDGDGTTWPCSTVAALAGAVPGSPPEPTTVTCRICRSPEQEHRGSTHHGFVPYRSAVVPGSPETRQEDEVDPASAVEWEVRTYTLASTPDSSLPILPIDDFCENDAVAVGGSPETPATTEETKL